MQEAIDNTVVIPCHNEEKAVGELVRQLTGVMKGLKGPYEVILVDDGSTDATHEKMLGLEAECPQVRVLHFTGRKGQTEALMEGFRSARGAVVISMDGDLQEDPEDIPLMLERLEKDRSDVVCGWRRQRNDSLRKLLVSRAGNFFQKAFFGTGIHDISCTFRVYRQKAIKSVNMRRRGLHRFLPLLLKKKGFRISEQEIKHMPRRYGQSKYSSKKVPETAALFFGVLFGRY